MVVDAGTQVVLAHARFTDDRLAVADELVRIARAGGSVRVLVGTDPDLLGPTVRERLVAAGIPLRRANIHDKLALLHSRHGVSRRPRKVVLSGSHNLNRDANWINDEILVKTFHDGLYDDVLASHVEPLWAAAEPDSPPSRDGRQVASGTYDGEPGRARATAAIRTSKVTTRMERDETRPAEARWTASNVRAPVASARLAARPSVVALSSDHSDAFPVAQEGRPGGCHLVRRQPDSQHPPHLDLGHCGRDPVRSASSSRTAWSLSGSLTYRLASALESTYCISRHGPRPGSLRTSASLARVGPARRLPVDGSTAA